MAGKKQRCGEIVTEYLKRYAHALQSGEISEKGLARLIHQEQPIEFSNIQQARNAIRYYRGKKSTNGYKTPDPIAPPTKHPQQAGASASSGTKESWDESGDTAVWSLDGESLIQTLDDALKHSKVDLTVWEVERHIFNTWTVTMKGPDGNPEVRTNVQVKVWFRRREDAGIDWGKVFADVKDSIRTAKPMSRSGKGVGMVMTADFHLGAYVNNLIRSDKFEISTLVQYLKKTAQVVNDHAYEEVHVAMLGDFIESFSGLNHLNSWKGLSKGAYGMNAVILCYEILRDWLKSIHNLKTIHMVSGNHDRVTADKEGDQEGEVGALLAYMLGMTFGKEAINYHPAVLKVVLDDICYVMTHGHLKLSEKEISKILFDYGDQSKYNVFAKAHKHTRQVVKSSRQQHIRYQDHVVVQLDDANYRAITVPPLFTGNFYSESLGFSSTAGFNLVENNGANRINIFDYCV